MGSYCKVNTDGNFSKFKARWVCRGFQDKHGWEQQTDSPTATRYGFRLACQQAASSFYGEHYNLSRRAVIIQLPSDLGLLPYLVGYCVRPVYGLNDAPRRWWNPLDKFMRAFGLVPTRADRCAYVCYEGAWREPQVDDKPNSANTAAEIEADSFNEEEAHFGHFLGSCCMKDPSVTSGHTEERSVEDYPAVANARTMRNVTEYTWRSVVDEALLKSLRLHGNS